MIAAVIGSEEEASFKWAKMHLRVDARGSKQCAAVISAGAELPLSARASFELMSHPDNAKIFRGIERCTYRKVLRAAADGGRACDGRQTVEVENESDWHFLFIKGSIRTRMLVQEDPTAGTIQVQLAPAGGNAPLQHMTCKWTFSPGCSPGSTKVTLEQEVHPRGLPPFFNNGFRAMAALQVKKTFEDLYAEALRMNAGRPSLAPYSQVARKQILFDGAATAAADEEADEPSSVLTAAYELESSSSAGSGQEQQQQGRQQGAAQRRRRLHGSGAGLRSHPISSLLDLSCLDAAIGLDSKAEATAAQAAATEAAAEAAPQAAGDDGGRSTISTWSRQLYTLLQKVWLASNAALGAAPNAVAELEEMGVLV